MPWFLSPSGWPTFADEGSLLAASLTAKGYDVLDEADVPAAIAAYQAGTPLPPPATDYVTQAELTAALAGFEAPQPTDATTTTKGIVALAGAFGGTADAPTVPGLADKVDAVDVGAPDGVASLGADGKLLADERPTITADDITDGTTLGRALVRATTEAGGRALIGAGTSELTIEDVADSNLFASQLDVNNAASSLFGRTAIADLPRTNTTTLTLDDELQFEGLAGERLEIIVRLSINLAAGGGSGTNLNAKWQVPAGTTGEWAREQSWSQPGYLTGSTGLTVAPDTAVNFRLQDGNQGVTMVALMTLGADGTVGLMWAQHAATAFTVTRKENSNLLIRRLNPP